MNEWQVVLVIISLIGLMSAVITPILKTTKVIQKNTDAINNLTTKLDEMTTNNSKDHDHFHSSINKLSKDVAVLQEKHRKD